MNSCQLKRVTTGVWLNFWHSAGAKCLLFFGIALLAQTAAGEIQFADDGDGNYNGGTQISYDNTRILTWVDFNSLPSSTCWFEIDNAPWYPASYTRWFFKESGDDDWKDEDTATLGGDPQIGVKFTMPGDYVLRAEMWKYEGSSVKLGTFIFYIHVKGPDLIVESITGVGSSYFVGDKINAEATVKNIGDASAGSFDILYMLCKAPSGTTVMEGGSFYLGLSADSSGTDSLNSSGWTIPAGTLPGIYKIVVWADFSEDQSRKVNELEEGNNILESREFTIFDPSITYTITYHPNGATSGSFPESQTKNQGVTLTLVHCKA